MASRIESDSPSKALRRQAEQNATPPVSAKPPAPGSSPKPIPKRGPEAAEQPEQEQAEDQESRPAGRGLLGQIPAWGISVLLHIVVLLAMALMVGESSQVEKPTVITSSTSEEEEEISEFEEPTDTPVEAPAVADPVAEVMVTTEVVVTPITVAAIADDVEAAPLAVELTEFGSETALASDMMSTIGAVGGKGGGLGGRANPGKQAARGGGGGDTEAAVDRALQWFAQHQMPEGHWTLDLKQCPSCDCSHPGGGGSNDYGATALALLPFLARGNTHLEGPYKKQVEQGIRYLVKRVIEGKGKIALTPDPSNANYYIQGLAGIALSECYAMSKDDQLAAPTQAVLNVIMEAQDPKGGGWRYGRGQPGDMSVTSWQIMALKSGLMADLQVNPLTAKKAIEFLDSVGTDDGAFYGYDEPGPIPAMTAAALLCRMYLGWKKDHPGLLRGAERIAREGPSTNLYYNYYATQVMYQMGGDMWISWNNQMKPLLLKTQSNNGHEAGSWFEGVSAGVWKNPGAGGLVEGYSGTRDGTENVNLQQDIAQDVWYAGRLYSTSLATLILEVYYRHLPIFGQQSTAEGFRD